MRICKPNFICLQPYIQRSSPVLFVFILMLFILPNASAQLVPCDKVYEPGTEPEGGCIERSLEDQIEEGHGTAVDQSIWLIQRDPFRSIRRGRQLFQRKFSQAEGLGPRVNFTSSGHLPTMRALGAGLMDSCAGCHGRPKGSAGFGGVVTTFPDSRDAPHLFGLGLVEMLADEITTDLRHIRAQAIDLATNGGGSNILLDENFNGGTGGFHYSDDVFNNTNQPNYAIGGQVPVPGQPGERLLVVFLGGEDNQNIEGMSGGWTASFHSPIAGPAELSTSFHIIQRPHYENDEYTDALIAINGQTLPRLGRVTGDGNGNGLNQLGPISVTIPINLVAGTNTLTLGAYNNKKTRPDESCEVRFGFASILGPGDGPVVADLNSKGINYGRIVVDTQGVVDYSQVEGIDHDLRIKPFFHHGQTISIREFILGALNDEMGLQVVDPILCDVANGIPRVSPAGFVYDPSLDNFSGAVTCDVEEDLDEDGVANELDPALVDHLEFYLLNYFKPGQYETTARTDQGLALMGEIGCTDCHVQTLTINHDRRVADVETTYDPDQGIFNQMFAVAAGRFVDDTSDADPNNHTRLPAGEAFVVDNFFSDLKRHDLGPAFHERDNDGSRITKHVTEPLWGVGSTAPYGHDGRSINLDQVIRRHGGEALASANAYRNLTADERSMIREYLNTLVLFPPDDTASNLNPGNAEADPQIPANHGNIALGLLFTTDKGKE